MTITKVMLEYSTGTGWRKIKPSAQLPFDQGDAEKGAAWFVANWRKLESKGYRLTFDGSQGEPLRVSYGKFHLIFRSN